MILPPSAFCQSQFTLSAPYSKGHETWTVRVPEIVRDRGDPWLYSRLYGRSENLQ